MIKRLCERLIELRGSKSQSAVARALGSSQQVYQRYETGERLPDSEMLLRLADHFHVSTDYLLGRTEISSIPTDGKLQAAAEVTGLSSAALTKLSRLQKQHSDTLSQLIEAMNAEYFLDLLTATIHQNIKSKNAHKGNDSEITKYLIGATLQLDIDGSRIDIYKSTLLASALQNAIIETADQIADTIFENGGANNG